MKYIDIHGHINFPEYDADREDVIKRANDAGVGIVSVGTDLESSKQCIEIAEKHDDVWAIIGLHPSHTTENSTEVDFDYQAYLSLAKHPKVIAIGECGLDYFHSKPEEIPKQKEIFLKQIEIANAVGKPLMLHVRNAKAGGVNAYHTAIEILNQHAKVPADFHFFAGTESDLKEAIVSGCSVSLTGVITFARNYDAIIKAVPVDRLMTETDCPYVAPIPFRGKRSEPIHVIEVVKQIAKVRGQDFDEMALQVLNNARKFFNIRF